MYWLKKSLLLTVCGVRANGRYCYVCVHKLCAFFCLCSSTLSGRSSFSECEIVAMQFSVLCCADAALCCLTLPVLCSARNTNACSVLHFSMTGCDPSLLHVYHAFCANSHCVLLLLSLLCRPTLVMSSSTTTTTSRRTWT